MLRSDFEADPIWQVAAAVNERIDQIRETATADEIATLGTIGFYRDHIDSFRTFAPQPEFFVSAMLTPVRGVLDDVVNYLDQRLSQGQGSPMLESARVTIESALLQMGPWPRPFARGGQVQQLNTLYENLLERQRLDLTALADRHAVLRSEIDSYRSEVAGTAGEVAAEVANLQTTATTTADQINSEKARIDEVVGEGLKQVNNIPIELEARSKVWQNEARKEFIKEMDDFKRQLDDKVQEGTVTLELLRRTEAEYANLASAAAGGQLSNHFAREARNNRIVGGILYGLGVAFLAGAATPLFFLLSTTTVKIDAAARWEEVVIRVGIGVAAASAATVAIRVAGRFMTNANATKRMELELRTFGPFLANVEDQKTVDEARIELVDKAFGRSYVPTGKESDDADTIQVSALSHVAELFGKYFRP